MIFDTPHRRFNPLDREWVLVSPQRTIRPWLGQVEKISAADLPVYDPDCYLCPGNERAGGMKNPDYSGTFVFDNDFAALQPFAETALTSPTKSLLVSEPEWGICRVMCFSPRHDLTLPELEPREIESVIETWVQQSFDLAARAEIAYVQVFENKGALMGCSNPHPHSQIWATGHLPNEPVKEFASQMDYYTDAGRPLLLDYLKEELFHPERVVAANDSFTAVIPFWAVWPFETLVIAHRPGVSRLADLSMDEVSGLADLIKSLTIMYDNLFEIPFPYSMGFHQAPCDGQPHPEWTLHAHYYPPLLRSASVRKFMVGFEMLAMPQRDITPEAAAERLRTLPKNHYKKR